MMISIQVQTDISNKENLTHLLPFNSEWWLVSFGISVSSLSVHDWLFVAPYLSASLTMPLATKLYGDGDEAAFLLANKWAKCKLWTTNSLYFACTITIFVLVIKRKIELVLLLGNIFMLFESVVLLASLLRIKSLISRENKHGLFKPNNKIAWLTIIVYFSTLACNVVNSVLILKLEHTDKDKRALIKNRSQICRQ